MSKLKDAQRDFIIRETVELFLSKSIFTVTISEIAKEIGIGEATMYRYFGTKQNLVLECANKLGIEVFNQYFQNHEGQNGYEKLENFYTNYLIIFRNYPSYYSFISEFDAFMMNEDSVNLREYEMSVDEFRKRFISAYEEGISDGSVRKLQDIESFYYSSTHSLLGLCKKLSAKKNFLDSDAAVDREKELSTLIDTFLYYLKG